VFARGPGDSIVNATRDLAEVPNIERVVPTYHDFARLNASPTFFSIEVYLLGSSFTGVLDCLGLSWTIAPGPGMIVLPSSMRGTLRDVSADPARLTPDQLRAVVHLLHEKTLPSVLGSEGAEMKAKLWMSWVEDGAT